MIKTNKTTQTQIEGNNYALHTNNENANTKPFIFTKKIKDNHKIIPLNKTINTLGPNRHFPTSTKEWSNSIYTYNQNSMKNLSIADKNLNNLLKSYFNLYYGVNLLKTNRIAMRVRRLDLDKIFVGKTELKHTNSKVIINLFVYNEQIRYLNEQINEFKRTNFPSSYPSNLRNNIGRIPLSLAKKLKMLDFYKNKITGLDILNMRSLDFTNTLNLEKENLLNINIETKLYKEKLLLIENLELALNHTNYLIEACKLDDNFHSQYTENIQNTIKDIVIGKDIETISKLKMLLTLNKSKFEDKYLLKLKDLVSQIYNKKVEFNFINLKYIYLDSDIFTQAIAVKLKDRDNRVERVLKTCVDMFKLPKGNRIIEKYGKSITNFTWVNKIKNMTVNSYFNSSKGNKDILNQMLLDTMPNFTFSNTTPILSNSSQSNKSIKSSKVITIQGLVLNALKDKKMAGIRLEARGRLTRRFTASRSLFVVNWNGSLKNINASYKGLSSVMLRGHAKSNVQYSFNKNTTRIGAFGLKGWISGKY